MSDQAPDGAKTGERGILATCENGHEQRILLPQTPRGEAVVLAGFLDGTSALFRTPPREHELPGSKLGRCGLCNAWLTCALFGYGE